MISLYGGPDLGEVAYPMENRIDALFHRLQADGKKAFVAYVCAGDPGMERCRTVVKALAEAGADLIEMGFRPGPLFSEILEDLVEGQLAGAIVDAETARSHVLDRRNDSSRN